MQVRVLPSLRKRIRRRKRKRIEMTRRLRILKACKNKLFDRLKANLATDKQIRDMQALQIRIERAEGKIKDKQLKEIETRYKENINAIINESTIQPGTTIRIDFEQTGQRIENGSIPH